MATESSPPLGCLADGALGPRARGCARGRSRLRRCPPRTRTSLLPRRNRGADARRGVLGRRARPEPRPQSAGCVPAAPCSARHRPRRNRGGRGGVRALPGRRCRVPARCRAIPHLGHARLDARDAAAAAVRGAGGGCPRLPLDGCARRAGARASPPARAADRVPARPLRHLAALGRGRARRERRARGVPVPVRRARRRREPSRAAVVDATRARDHACRRSRALRAVRPLGGGDAQRLLLALPRSLERLHDLLPHELALLRPEHLRATSRAGDRGARRPDVAACHRVLARGADVVVLWAGLVFSYSQSSLASLFLAVLAITLVAGDRRRA